MALTSIRLQNFKSFADSGNVPLAPLTVIFGRNNTGKSSILHSLLLLRQSYDSPDYGARLNLRGPLYAAGPYADIIHQHRLKEHLSFGMSFSATDGAPLGSIELEFASDEPRPPRLVKLLTKVPGHADLEIHRGVGQGGPYELWIGDKKIGKEREADFRVSPISFLPRIGMGVARVGRPNEAHERSRAGARRVISALTEMLTSVRAVGAFRSQPERRYEFLGGMPNIAGSVGADVVNALIEDATRRKGRGQLIASVNRWLREVGRVRLMPIRSISTKARIYELRLKDTDSGRWANFADVGFGIGQSLPVFVEGLRVPEGGTFLVQEPEINLHPDAQIGMADFLIALIQNGRRVIVETHSESVLLRIRHAILGIGKGKSRKKLLPRNDVSILCVDKGEKGTSKVRALKIDELGQIKGWPTGFMEQATNERLAILEQMAKKAVGDQ